MEDHTNVPDTANEGLQKLGEVVEVIDEGEVVEIVDIEIFGKENRRPPRAKQYRFRVDRDYFTVENRFIKGATLFALAKKSPSEYRMHQKLHGGQMKEVTIDETIDLGEPGIERFVTMKLSEGDGGQVATTAPPRREFRLPGDDEGYLDSLSLRWETVKNEKVRWVLLHDHPLPPGYAQSTAIIAIRIEGGYPPGALDMASFLPPLTRADGRPIHAVSLVAVDGKEFQQWSRHYAWQEDVDSLATHHLHVKSWLEAEPKR